MGRTFIQTALVTLHYPEAVAVCWDRDLLRHSCSQHMLEGGPDKVIQKLLGDASLETTAIYTEMRWKLCAGFTRLVPRRKRLEREETMSYTESMTIEHQILTDEDGKPTAALIPWDLFQRLQAMHESLENDGEPISDEFRDELNRRVQALKDGTTKGIPHDEAMADLRSIIDQKESA